MQAADLPIEKAHEPDEEARQPQKSGMSPPSGYNKIMKHGITFAEGTQSTEVSSSQNTGSYKDVLSQPAMGLSHKQRLLWLQKRRGTGLWVQCDDCGHWRYLPHVVDSHELPAQWFCKMNPDRTAADCSVPEVPIRLRDEEDLIHSEYSAGSVVWARLPGWPWWPAMVDDCPDTEQFYWLDGFSDIPTHYNVVFFDTFEVTRAWISPENLKPYGANRKSFKLTNKERKYKKRLDVAIKQADDADMLPLANRLAKYSFITRYKGTIGQPKKINKKALMKFKQQLKRKLNIDISDSENDSEGSLEDFVRISPKRQAMKNKNVIIVGTPKRKINKNNAAARKIADDIDKSVNSEQDTIIINDDLDGNDTENQPNDSSKQPTSLMVQIGSNSAIINSMNINNDSSKMYVPETVTTLQTKSALETSSEFQDLQVRIATPSSDDFEF